MPFPTMVHIYIWSEINPLYFNYVKYYVPAIFTAGLYRYVYRVYFNYRDIFYPGYLVKNPTFTPKSNTCNYSVTLVVYFTPRRGGGCY